MFEFLFVWLLIAFAVLFVALNIYFIATAIAKAVLRHKPDTANLEPELAAS